MMTILILVGLFVLLAWTFLQEAFHHPNADRN